MARTPTFIREFVPYSTVKQNELKWSSYAASRISYNRNLLAREFGVDPDKVYSTFANNFKKHTKDFPLAAVDTGTEKNKKDYEKQEQYVLFLWQYYVVDKPKKVSLPKQPKKTTVQKPNVEDSYDEQEIDPDNPYAGDDEPSMLEDMRRVKPPKGGTLVKKRGISKKDIYERVRNNIPDSGKKPDELEEFDLPQDIRDILGEDFIAEIFADGYTTYDDFFSALFNWQKKEGKSATPEAKAKIANFRRNVVGEKKQAGAQNKFKLKSTSVSTSNFLNTNKLGGAPEQPQLLLAPGGGDKKKKKRKASLEENVAAIRKSVENIFKVLSGQFKALKKQFDVDKRNAQKQKRSKREAGLEFGKAILSQARRLAAPTFDLLDRLFKFIGTILLGRVLVKLLDWIGDPKNKEKVEALGKFLEDWWPVLLGLFVMFATPLGSLISTVLAGVVKLSLFMARKAIPALVSFVAKNPLAAAAIGTGIAAGVMAFRAKDSTEQQLEDKGLSDAPPKQQADELSKPGSIMETFTRGILPSLNGPSKFAGGGQVRRTMPSGGKITQSTGKRVRGAGKDTQMIVAQPGEVVMSKPAVDKIGAPFLLNLNKMGGGTNQPTYGKFGDIQFAQGGGYVGPEIDRDKVMRSLKKAYIGSDDLGGRENEASRIQNITNWLYGTGERLNTEGLDDIQIMDLQREKISYPNITIEKREFQKETKSRSSQENKPKARSKPMGMVMGQSVDNAGMGADGDQAVFGEQSQENNVSPVAAAIPLTGILPKEKEQKESPGMSSKPPAAMLGKGNLPPAPPEAPSSKVSVITQSNTIGDVGSKSAPGSTGARDLPTDFDAFVPSESRLMMLAIYGITEVE